VEIYLSKLNQLEDQAASSTEQADYANFEEEQRFLKDEFKTFLEVNKVHNRTSSLIHR
jgi:hypothetical protein